MTRFERTFLTWSMILLVVVIFANLPRTIGKDRITYVGLPWVFSHWSGGRLLDLDAWALWGDLALGFAVTVLVPLACAWARTRQDRQQGATAKGSR